MRGPSRCRRSRAPSVLASKPCRPLRSTLRNRSGPLGSRRDEVSNVRSRHWGYRKSPNERRLLCSAPRSAILELPRGANDEGAKLYLPSNKSFLLLSEELQQRKSLGTQAICKIKRERKLDLFGQPVIYVNAGDPDTGPAASVQCSLH